MTLNHLWTILLDLLFPPRCPICGRIRDGHDACPDCLRNLPFLADGEREQTLADRLRCASALWYEGTARDGILRYKFRGAAPSAELFGQWMAECAADCYPGEFDTVTWVPVSKKRLRRRGYDQAQLLAEAICRRWDTRPQRLLSKVGDNPAQSGIHDAAARRANVLGMFDAVGDLSGRRILLVDDIVTTGATISECARVLRMAGAESVVCLTLARARSHKNAQSTENALAKARG